MWANLKGNDDDIMNKSNYEAKDETEYESEQKTEYERRGNDTTFLHNKNINEDDKQEFNEAAVKNDYLHSIADFESECEHDFKDFNEDCGVKDPLLTVGMKFTSGKVFRKALKE